MNHAMKADQFRALHHQGCFIMPNAWDAGSARLLSGMGFPAIARNSASRSVHILELRGV